MQGWVVKSRNPPTILAERVYAQKGGEAPYVHAGGASHATEDDA